jgi:hypothetical protein
MGLIEGQRKQISLKHFNEMKLGSLGNGDGKFHSLHNSPKQIDGGAASGRESVAITLLQDFD